MDASLDAAPTVTPSVPEAPRGAAAGAFATAQREAATTLRASPGPAWSQVRIEADGVAMVVPRANAGQLAGLVARALASPTDPAVVEGPAILQIELGQGSEPLGLLSLHGDRWRWAPAGDPRGARALALQAGLSAALLQEAQRLLQR